MTLSETTMHLGVRGRAIVQSAGFTLRAIPRSMSTSSADPTQVFRQALYVKRLFLPLDWLVGLTGQALTRKRPAIYILRLWSTTCLLNRIPSGWMVKPIRVASFNSQTTQTHRTQLTYTLNNGPSWTVSLCGWRCL